MARYVLALDQGTTSSRSILFDHDGSIVAQANKEFEQIYPEPGHVEHDPEAIWKTQLATARKVLREAKAKAEDVAAIGITNQRETVVLWERETGKPVHNAIVWQSRITAPICDGLREEGYEETFRKRTGLLIDPYFAGTKIKWLLDRDPKLRRLAERGEVLAGTIDCYLLWRLTGGKMHATDYSNASRTLLFNIHKLEWDEELLKLLGVPRAMLPEVRDSSGVLGETGRRLFGGRIPIAGMAGDQMAATFGQACFRPGMAKTTYGTGAFVLINTGHEAIVSREGLLTTIGWGIEGKVTYCLEGAIFIAGAGVQWLRDGLKLIRSSSEIEKLASTVEDNGGVYFVPALVGLGAPFWDPYARGTIVGLERSSSGGHLARATLEAMAYRTRDVCEAMLKDVQRSQASLRLSRMRVDGGACVNDLLMQFQADIIGRPVQRPKVAETTALGAAYLAGLAVGFWKSQKELGEHWTLEREFKPAMKKARREALYGRWREAVERARDWTERRPAQN